MAHYYFAPNIFVAFVFCCNRLFAGGFDFVAHVCALRLAPVSPFDANTVTTRKPLFLIALAGVNGDFEKFVSL
ncbi:hypothetical protein WQ49_34045 [Burkholderia cenocepacia]|nr:hypothetical protein BURCENK562V_C0040 [Burkholderia cenocepacia K56-2Valvano]KKI79625.1 hypothetical protein WQ49_34045 [Burkholderia cenocepacia]